MQRNLKKHNVYFAILPTIGYMTDWYNSRPMYTISLMFLFFQLNINYLYEPLKPEPK